MMHLAAARVRPDVSRKDELPGWLRHAAASYAFAGKQAVPPPLAACRRVHGKQRMYAARRASCKPSTGPFPPVHESEPWGGPAPTKPRANRRATLPVTATR